MTTAAATTAETYLATIGPRAIKVLRSDCLGLEPAVTEAIIVAIEEDGDIDERLAITIAVLRVAGYRVPESATIKKGVEIAKPERDEWLVLTYSGATTAPRPKIRNARSKDYRKGRHTTYVPTANRER